MKKKLQDMERLYEKMQARFGPQDDLVMQFKQELSVLLEKRQKDLAIKKFGRRNADKTDGTQSVH